MAIKLGLQAKLFYGTAGALAATEATNVKDVSINLEAGSADITSRAASGWRAKKGTLKDGTVEFGMNYDTSETFCSTLMTTFLTNGNIALFVSDGDNNGLDADFTITNFSMSQPLEEAITVNVTAAPTLIGGTASRSPAWITGGTRTL